MGAFNIGTMNTGLPNFAGAEQQAFYDALTNSLNAKKAMLSMPYVEPMLETQLALQKSGLESKQIANQLAPMQAAIKAAYMQAQAQNMMANAQLNQYKLNNPSLLTNSDLGLMYLMSTGAIPRMGNQARAQDYGANIDLNFLDQNTGLQQETEIPVGSQGMIDPNDILSKVNKEAPQIQQQGVGMIEMPDLPALKTNNSQPSVQTDYKSWAPAKTQMPSTGDPIMDQLFLAKYPGMQKQNEFVYKQNAQDQEFFNKNIPDVMNDSENSQHLLRLMEQFNQVMKDSNYFATLGPAATAADYTRINNARNTAQSIADAMTPLVAKQIGGKNTSDMDFKVAEKSKLSPTMSPETIKLRFAELYPATLKHAVKNDFYTKLQGSGLIRPQFISTVWQQFLRDFEPTGDLQVDSDAVKSLNYYLQPSVIDKIMDGSYQKINLDDINTIPNDLLPYLTVAQKNYIDSKLSKREGG